MPTLLRAAPRYLAFATALAVASAAVVVSGCKPKASIAAPDAAADGRHPLVGTVVTVNAERGSLLIDHEEIRGYMPAMTMEFKVAAGDLAVARAGQRIRGTMYQAADGFHLEQIWPAGAAGERIVSEAQRGLRQETVTRGGEAYREIGERLPDFALYDQNGVVVPAARFRGRQLVLNFIFTRCPDANMCPASTAKMMHLQQVARAAGVNNLELVSITLDPEFDTPGVLHDYAQARGIDTSNFTFLTGPEAAIKDLLAQLGVLSFKEGPLIRHTLSTVLIDAEGRIAYREEGSQWEPDEFASRLRRPEAAPSS